MKKIETVFPYSDKSPSKNMVGGNEKPCLLIDNNAFDLFLKSASLEQKFVHAVLSTQDSSIIASNAAEGMYLVTPFVALEAFGILKKMRLPLEQQRVESMSCELRKDPARLVEKIKEIHDEVLGFYRGIKELNEEFLEQAVQEKMKCRGTLHERKFLDHYSKQLMTPEFREQAAINLAIDYVQKFQYPRNVRKDAHRYFLDNFVYAMQDKIDLPFYRLAKPMLEVLQQKLKAKFGEEHFRKMRKSIGTTDRDDHLDCEFIHYVVTGYRVGDETLRVQGCTADRFEVIWDRVWFYRELLSFLRSLHPDMAHLLPTSAEGVIHFIDRDHQVISASLNVKDVDGPITK